VSSSPKYSYSLYGKNLRSEFALHLPPQAGGPCDVEIAHSETSLDPGLPLRLSPGGTGYVELEDRSLFLQWRDIFEFMISPDGSLISSYALSAPQESVLETLVLGPVISFALLKLGIEQIHATAVVIDGEAVAFVGESTFGKSTLAASFVQAGCKLLTDDLLVVTRSDGRVWAQPGPQRIKLFPETAREVLGYSDENVERNPLTPKLLIPLDAQSFQQTAVPLKTVYVLNVPNSTSTRITIRTMSQRNACINLLRNNYNTVIMDSARVQEPFALATSIATTVPVKTLSYARDFATLAEVRDAVLEDVVR
jgi:hypothetical protein